MNNNLLAENELEKAAGGAITKFTKVTLDKDGNVVAKSTFHAIYSDDPDKPDGLGEFKFFLKDKSDEIAIWAAKRIAGVSGEIVEKRVETKIV